jgi:hypothetical protein
MPLNYTATYDPDTDVGDVRASIQDIRCFADQGDTLPDPDTPRAQWSVIFTDQEVQKKIDKHLGAVNQNDLAAADLLEDIASSAAQLAKLLSLGSYTRDTRTLAAGLRAQAAGLRLRYINAQQSAAEEGAESITTEIWDDFSWRRYAFNRAVGG